MEKYLKNNFYVKWFAVVGGICGYYYFQYCDERFVKGFGLHVETAILTIPFIGTLLGLFDKYLQTKK
ncbi:hypothetical protein AC625_19285 [Peribacillus loiseleuriae]|uniref:Uncharacterized protein n=1 Tax=Peribacillus loiseleuriae TaxID=1679170 RepID=A0A0K9GXR0_9BACI|nr:hypothetical protein AC625_19285 [Peribacillus loiseleuriae]